MTSTTPRGAGSRPVGDTGRLSVLVVSARDLEAKVAGVLDALSVVIRSATSVEEARTFLAAQSVDVVVLDGEFVEEGSGEVLRLFTRDPSTAVIVAVPSQALVPALLHSDVEDFVLLGESGFTELEWRRFRRAVAREVVRRRLAASGSLVEEGTPGTGESEPDEPAAAVEPDVLPGRRLPVTAGLYDERPLSRAAPGDMATLAARYRALLDLSLETAAFHDRQAVATRHAAIVGIASRLVELNAAPRDVIEMHVSVLGPAMGEVGPRRARAYQTEARMLVLELMGHLAAAYRLRSLTSQGGNES